MMRWSLPIVLIAVAFTALGAPKKRARPAKADAGVSAAATTKGKALRFGTLEIVVHGSASVFVDDRDLGTTPVKPIKLLEGRHRVRFVNPELGLDQTQDVDIKGDQVSTLEVSFEG